MDPVVDPRAAGGNRLWVIAAIGVVFAGVVVFLLVDLRTSVHEARVLRSGVLCTEATASDCLAQAAVVLGPFNDSIRTRMVSVYVRDIDAGPDDRDIVNLLPADHEAVWELGEAAVAHRVDGRIVALSRTTGSERIAPAMSGLHAVVVDASFVVTLVGLLMRAYANVRAVRRAGVGWSGRKPYGVTVRARLADAVMLLGVSAAAVSFFLATWDVWAWVVAAVVVLIGWWGAPLSRRLRGTGRHAA